VKTRIIFLFILLLMFNMVLIAQTPEWQWANQAGGIAGDDAGYKIAVDATGNSYVTGWFIGTATFGSYTLTSSGSEDMFIAKMDAIGNWQWATRAGGTDNERGYGITIDDEGFSYVTGYFWGTSTFGPFTLTSSGSWDIFVAKIDTAGNWEWVTQAGGSSGDKGYGITIDNSGYSYVTGYFGDTATFGSYSITSSGGEDIFVAKIDADGNWQWAKSAGAFTLDYGQGIIVDIAGNCYVIGYFEGTATFGSFTLTSSGHSDIFVASLGADGSSWLWATRVGGTYYDFGKEITGDDLGNCYVIGYFEGTATFSTYSITSSGMYDIFVAKIDTFGNWQWATQAGGSSSDEGYGIAIDDAGNSYVTGGFRNIATFGSYSLTSSGGKDIFVAMIDTNGNWQWATQAGGTGWDIGVGITIDNSENSYVTGVFENIATFGSYSLTSSGSWDVFVAKLSSSLSTENVISHPVNILSNYPNPFNPETTISFGLKSDSHVLLQIYNNKGQLIKTLVKKNISTGNHNIIWNGKDDKNNSVSSGIYLYKLNVNGKTEAVKKCLLLK